MGRIVELGSKLGLILNAAKWAGGPPQSGRWQPFIAVIHPRRSGGCDPAWGGAFPGQGLDRVVVRSVLWPFQISGQIVLRWQASSQDFISGKPKVLAIITNSQYLKLKWSSTGHAVSHSVLVYCIINDITLSNNKQQIIIRRWLHEK